MPLAILYGSDGGVLKAISIDSSGHLQVDALSIPAITNLDVALSTRASEAKLEAVRVLLDLLENALASVATDTLRTVLTAVLKGDWLSALPVTKGDWLSALPSLPAGANNIGDVDVVSSVLPTGAATSANQATEITSLQLIDDLRNALGTVATDMLRIHPVAVNLATGVLTYVSSASATVKASAGRVYWLLCKGGTDVAEISLRDGGSGGITKFVLKSPSGDSRYALFQPAIDCGTNIYILVVSGTSMEYAIGYI